MKSKWYMKMSERKYMFMIVDCVYLFGIIGRKINSERWERKVIKSGSKQY